MSVNVVLNKIASSVPSGSSRCLFWDVPQIISTQKRKHHKYAVLILNRPLTQSQHFLSNLWNNATVRVTVDGGTNQWDTFLERLPAEKQKTMKLPDLITGDFDSIPDAVFEKYRKKGCEMIHTPDQNHTDFTKALMELYSYCQEREIDTDHIVALGQSSGRLDQVLGNIQTLYLVKEKGLVGPKMKVYLMTDDALSWLLTPGEHVITIPKETRLHRRAWCSLVPIGETCQSITTTGLRWNLTHHTLKFGDLVSTSNTFAGADIVTIKCTNTVLWSLRIPSVTGE